MRTAWHSAVIALGIMLGGVNASAQRMGTAPFDDWRTAWSPLVTRATDAPPLGPVAPSLPELLTRPAPRIGLAWTLGHASALATDSLPPSGQFVLAREQMDGDYRRVTEPTRVGTTTVGAFGARRVGSRTTFVGRAALARGDARDGTNAVGLAPLGGSPMVPIDTASPDMSSARALLEGAISTRRGAWLGGVAAGLEEAEATAQRARLARVGRGSAPGASAGLGRRVLGDALALSVQARWFGRTETTSSVANPGFTTLFPFDGLSVPDPWQVTSSSPYFRRTLRDGRSWSSGASGRAFGATWMLGAELERLRESAWIRRSNDPPKDRWSEDGRRLSGAVQRAVPVAGLVTVRGHVATADGTANRASLNGTITARTRRELALDGEARRVPATLTSWSWAVGGGVTSASDAQRDGIVRIRADLRATRGDAWGELARGWTSGWAASLAAGVSGYGTSGAIVDGATLEPAARRYVAPSIEHDASAALAWHVGVTVRQRGTRAAPWVRVAARRVTPRGEAAPLRPSGERTAIEAALGLTLP